MSGFDAPSTAIVQPTHGSRPSENGEESPAGALDLEAKPWALCVARKD